MGRDIDLVIAEVKAKEPQVLWRQIPVAHPGADDDGLWLFWFVDRPGEVQVESSNGTLPFLVETDKHPERYVGHDSDTVVSKVVAWLRQPGGRERT